jgi:hypothetical protein
LYHRQIKIQHLNAHKIGYLLMDYVNHHIPPTVLHLIHQKLRLQLLVVILPDHAEQRGMECAHSLTIHYDV